MAGTKRNSDEAGVSTRGGGAKVARTSPRSKKGGKKGPKAMAESAFKKRALPLHVNVTHTPPSIPDSETVPAATADPGFLAAISLQPTSFNTGSYGWKGNKRLTIEMDDPEGGEGKEKVHVMLQINATVVGSKQAKDGAEAGEEAAAEEEPAEVEESKEAEAAEE